MVEVTAHRGYSAKYPENTLLAFRAALELGVEWIEFDVIPSADGRVMVMHDQTVDRTTNGSGRVVEMTYEKLRRLDAGAHKGAPGEKIPTLEEAIETIGSQARLNVNLNFNDNNSKDEAERKLLYAYEAKTVRAVRDAGLLDRAVFAIYPVDQIKRMKAHDPAAECVLLSWRDGGDYVRQSVKLGLRVAQPGRDLMTPEFIRELHDAGLVGNVFYADTEEDMRSYIALGIDGILTNEPELLLKVRESISA